MHELINTCTGYKMLPQPVVSNKYINKAPNLKFLRNENREAKFRSLKVASSRYSNFSNDMYNMTAKH